MERRNVFLKRGEFSMQKFHILNKQSYSKTRQKNKISLTKAIIWAFFSIGAIALLTSLVYVSSILAFIGLGLIFWGAILLYIQPEQYAKKAILDATVIPVSYTHLTLPTTPYV